MMQNALYVAQGHLLRIENFLQYLLWKQKMPESDESEGRKTAIRAIHGLRNSFSF